MDLYMTWRALLTMGGFASLGFVMGYLAHEGTLDGTFVGSVPYIEPLLWLCGAGLACFVVFHIFMPAARIQDGQLMQRGVRGWSAHRYAAIDRIEIRRERSVGRTIVLVGRDGHVQPFPISQRDRSSLEETAAEMRSSLGLREEGNRPDP